MEQIYPMLWFDHQAEEAARFYTDIFPNSKVSRVARYPAAAPGPMPEGSVMTVDFELDGRRFVALNAGPDFRFNESISFVVPCESQAEIDRYWDKLVAGGEAQPCGWLKDRYGLSWQIVPTELDRMMSDSDPEKARRVAEAVWNVFGKLNLDELRAAFNGEPASAATR